MKSILWYKLKNIVPKILQEPIINIIYFSRSLFYYGDNVSCPVCNNSFTKFLGDSTSGDCPKCGSGARHRIMYLYLKNKTNFFKDNLKVLHFAPEHCFYKTFKQLNNLSYISADLGSARAMEKIDITNIKYPSNYFDVIISSHVLEHIPNDTKAMSELFRVLKNGGWSIHLVPIDYKRDKTFEDAKITTAKERQLIYGHHDHKRIYGKDYKKKLENVGFKVKVISYNAGFSSEIGKNFGINKEEKIYYCTKL